jgi:hypothetical protein
VYAAADVPHHRPLQIEAYGTDVHTPNSHQQLHYAMQDMLHGSARGLWTFVFEQVIGGG